jgi:hypothetical protein
MRHVDVEDDEIGPSVLPVIPSGSEEVEGFHAVPYEMRFVRPPQALKQGSQQMRRRRIVIDDEDTKHDHPFLFCSEDRALHKRKSFKLVRIRNQLHETLRAGFRASRFPKPGVRDAGELALRSVRL